MTKKQRLNQLLSENNKLYKKYNSGLISQITALQQSQEQSIWNILKQSQTNNFSKQQIQSLISQQLHTTNYGIKNIVNNNQIPNHLIIKNVNRYRDNTQLLPFDEEIFNNNILNKKELSNRKLINRLGTYNTQKSVSALKLINEADFLEQPLTIQQEKLFNKYSFNKNNLQKFAELKSDEDINGSTNDLSKEIDKYFLYAGIEDGDNREFCETWVGTIQTKDFWDNLGNTVWIGKVHGSNSIWIYTGGWNCRHVLVAWSK